MRSSTSTKTVIINSSLKLVIHGLCYIVLLLTFQTNDTIKAELQNEAKDLRFIQTQINSTIKPQLVCSLNTKEQHTETENN